MLRDSAWLVGVGLATITMAFGCEATTEWRDNADRTRNDVAVTTAALAAGCTISGAAMTVTVKDGESALISLRSSDSFVTVNGNIFSGATDTGLPCEIATPATMSVIADSGGTHTMGRTVILDYQNGLYMTAASTTPALRIDFTLSGDNGALNALRVRGSAGIDLFVAGAGTGSGASQEFALNVNAKRGSATTQVGGTGGQTVTLDQTTDVGFKNVGVVSIDGSGGDDVLDASGSAGTGAAFPNPITLIGSAGADTLIGGTAGDTLNGGVGDDIMNGCAGDDTYSMGSSAAGADVIAEACTSNEGKDTVDYSSRKNALMINLSRTLTASNSGTDGVLSGEASGDGAHISDKVTTIRLGSGDDTLTIPATSTIVHSVFGGAGDDSFTGGGAADGFDGQAGDDTCVGATSVMDYSSRTAPVTVTGCATGCSSSDANDGDPSTTGSTHTGSSAATSSTGGIDLVTLTGGSGFSASSVGRTLTLSACSGGSGDETGYPIVRYLSASSVQIDVTGVSGYATDTCSFSEAIAGGSPNTGSGATLSAKRTTGRVTGIDHTSNLLGHTIALLHSGGSTGGGSSHNSDDGTYPVVSVLNATSVAIDDSAVGTFMGGVTALAWTESGAEHDNVQCGTILGGSGSDTISGDSRNNRIRGGAGDDILSGGSGDDVLLGEAGGDTLYGGLGADTLIGGTGTGTDTADTLVGGDGNDILEGDAASDTFTCDGLNSSTAGTSDVDPGDSDITVDYVMGTDVSSTGCEF